MRLVVGLLAIGACGRLDFAATEKLGDASSEEAFGAWSAPTWLGATIDSKLNDADPTISSDGLELYLSSDRAGGLGLTDIYVTTRADLGSPWVTPTLVTELSTPDYDDSPELSNDGLRMWLSSTSASHLHRVKFASRATRISAWSTPVDVPELSSADDDTNVAISGDELDALVEHQNNGQADLYEHRRAATTEPWGVETLVVELASPDNESGQCLDETGLVTFFASNRPGSVGEFDIYTAARPTLADPFSTPTKVVELSSAYSDGNVFLARDGHTIYMHSDRPGGLGDRDVWMATR